MCNACHKYYTSLQVETIWNAATAAAAIEDNPAK
jgi:hypothetical protein